MSDNSHQHNFKMISHNTLVNFTQTQYNKCKIWLIYNTACAVVPISQAKSKLAQAVVSDLYSNVIS